MQSLKLNETPVRTSRNFNINNIKLENIEVPDNVKDFNNMNIINETSKIKIEDTKCNASLTYGLGDILINQIKEMSNKKIKIVIDSKTNKEVKIDFGFDSENKNLLEYIEIIANVDSKVTIILKYYTNEDLEFFHNGIIKVFAKENSNVNIVLVNLMNSKSNNFLNVENEIETSAKINYTIVDFGGKNSITNYYSNLVGNMSENKINTIYIGKEKSLLDLNYIGELKGEKSNITIEVQGALKDYAKKHFKGTIDFKRGAKKAEGNENESCMLLSDNAKSLALPMLLCSEEDVVGNHSNSCRKSRRKGAFLYHE